MTEYLTVHSPFPFSSPKSTITLHWVYSFHLLFSSITYFSHIRCTAYPIQSVNVLLFHIRKLNIKHQPTYQRQQSPPVDHLSLSVPTHIPSFTVPCSGNHQPNLSLFSPALPSGIYPSRAEFSGHHIVIVILSLPFLFCPPLYPNKWSDGRFFFDTIGHSGTYRVG